MSSALKNKVELILNINLKEIVKFGIVGVIATAIHYITYYLLLNFFIINIAFTIGYILGFIVNFFLSTRFTFSVEPNIKRGLGFIVSNVVNYSLSIGLLNVFLIIGLSKQMAPVFVFSICIPINFLIVRYFLKK